jgi:integrase/recombinase XerD
MGTDDDSAVLLAEFRTWLDQERGLSPVSVRCYSRQAKCFLAAVGGPGVVSALDAGKVTAFMVGHSKDRNGWSAKIRGWTGKDMDAAFGRLQRRG